MAEWWIEEPRILGCADPSSEQLRGLYERGFRLLISFLNEPEERPACPPSAACALGFERICVPVRDMTAPSIADLDQVVGLLESVRGRAGVVLHCRGGKGRTGTFAAAYLVSRGATADAAIAEIRRRRPGAIETPEQERVIHDYASHPLEP